MLEEKKLKGIIRMLKAIQERVEIMIDERGEEAQMGIGTRQYNAIVEHLVDSDMIPDGLFIELDEDSPANDVDLCCVQLAGYLEGLVEDSEEKKNSGKNGIGELIREAMPEWVKEQVIVNAATSPVMKKAMTDLEDLMTKLDEQMQDLAQQMEKEDISEEKVRELAEQMHQLGHQQAELAKHIAFYSSPKIDK